MPRVLPWRELGSSLDAEAADDIIFRLKSHSTTKSNIMACSLCGHESPHGMRYKLLKCESTTCSDLTCSWRGKVLLCFDTEETSIYELGEHYTITSSPKRAKLTSTHKNICKELAQQRLRPLRIQNALVRRFELPARDAPPLAAVQNFCNYYCRTELDNHDRLDELTQWIHAHAFTGSEDENEVFTFAWSLNDDGKPVVGDGSDEEPFIIGLTTKTLLKRLEMSPDQYVLHMDATFMNTSDYPVVVVGISDRGRSFHLVALFIVSQREQPIYEACLASLSRQYTWITRKTLTPRYVMGDAEQAQRNAFFSVFHYSTNMQYLMCFFHVMTNVEKRLKGFHSHVAGALVRGLYDMHFARDQISFESIRDRLLQTWRSYSGLVDFCSYFQAQWLSGDFVLWQCYLTPSGCATTNNPTEQFNKVLKRDYTLRRRLKMGTLLKQLKDCCRNESSRPRVFRLTTEAAPALNRRSRELVREQLLVWIVKQTVNWAIRVLSMS